VLRLVRKLGIPSSAVKRFEENSGNFKEYKPKKGTKYYYYWGPDDQKTRPFCHDLLKIDKVISEDDIAVMSIELGYDVLKYKGSYNCRHTWRSFRGEIIPNPPITVNQIRKLIDKGIPA
jgi:hypothetical protein